MMRIFKGEKFTVITHFDLDGAGGPLLLKYCFDGVTKVSPCGYGKLTGVIEKNAQKNLVITDLSLTQEQVDLVDELYENVYLFDHHPASKKLDFPKHWKTFINDKCCATKLIYLWLTHIGYDVSHAKTFVDHVNDYDMWEHKIPASRMLNNAFWDLSFWKFSYAFKDKFTWDPELWKKAKEIEVIKQKEISEYETYLLEDLVRVVLPKKHVSDISLFYTEQKHFLFLKEKTMSVRSIFDLTNFYDQLNELKIEAGGHENAGGITFDGDPMVVIELFFNYVKERA